jgi:hypothetical protein
LKGKDAPMKKPTDFFLSARMTPFYKDDEKRKIVLSKDPAITITPIRKN